MSKLHRADKPRPHFGVLIAAICAIALMADSASAERRRKPERPSVESIGSSINSNTVSVVSGNLNGTYISIGYDLSAVLDDGDNLRILPVVGKGGGQNIRDVRFLKGVDVGITQSNLLSMMLPLRRSRR